MKKYMVIIFISVFASLLYSITFDKTLYLKIPNRYGDYSYISQKEILKYGYKIQYIKLSIEKINNNLYLFEPAYKFYSADKFENFYYYSKMKMYNYHFLTYTVNLNKMNTDEFLFDTQTLINGAAKSPILLLQRLFVDKNFYDSNGNIIENPQNKIFLYLIDSSHFERLLPEGDYIKDFFICVYYNKDNLTDEQILSSLDIDGLPLPVADYEKYTLFEDSVMRELESDLQKAKEAENKLYSNLEEDLKKIKRTKEVTKPKEISAEKKIIKNTKKTVQTQNDTLMQSSLIKQVKEKTNVLPKVEKKEKNTDYFVEEKKIAQNKADLPNKAKEKIIKEIKIFIDSSSDIEKAKLSLTIKGNNYKKPQKFKFYPLKKKISIKITPNKKVKNDTLIFKISKGYLINGIFSDSSFTITTDLNKIKKIKLEIEKLPGFNIVFIDKSEILPIEWVGIDPIIKDLKKTLKKSRYFGIFYVENEKIKGKFFENINQSCENYIWEKIYPLATSSGIRMDHLFFLYDKWNKSKYSKQFEPVLHLFLSRATLKSMIAMDDWELTKKKFKQLKERFGDCKIIIHAKIKKRDNIPLFKLGLPFKKIK